MLNAQNYQRDTIESKPASSIVVSGVAGGGKWGHAPWGRTSTLFASI